MNKIFYINTILFILLVLVSAAGFIEETFIYMAVWMGFIIAVLQTILVLFLIEREGPKWYYIADLIIILTAIFLKDRTIFYLIPLSIIYISILFYIKAKQHDT